MSKDTIDLKDIYEYHGTMYNIRCIHNYGIYAITFRFHRGNNSILKDFSWNENFYVKFEFSDEHRVWENPYIRDKELAERIIKEAVRHDKLSVFK